MSFHRVGTMEEMAPMLTLFENQGSDLLLRDLSRMKLLWLMAVCKEDGCLPLMQDSIQSRSVQFMLGTALGITEKIEAQPQTPLLILQARPRDEGVRPCNSDLSFPLLG